LNPDRPIISPFDGLTAEEPAPMKIAALQMVSGPDRDENLAHAQALIAQAAAAGAQLVALPEYFCLMGQNDRDKLAIAEPAVAPGQAVLVTDAQRPMQAMLSHAAQAHGVWVIGGTLPLQLAAAAPGAAVQRVRNACTVWAPDGTLATRYDKIHLFSFDNGRERYDEARVLEAGDKPVAFDASWPAAPRAEPLRVGLSICYDLRFPELFRALMAPPCDLIAVPAAFTHTTGQAHWELLLRARAVENQCFVIAPAQGGLHPNGRRTWGHSLVIDPWGEVLAVQAEGEGVVLADIDLQRLADVRRQLPALGHRRL
jgi:nitrilase